MSAGLAAFAVADLHAHDVIARRGIRFGCAVRSGVDCAIAKIPEERKLVSVRVDGVGLNGRRLSHSDCGRRSQFERRRTICGNGTSVDL